MLANAKRTYDKGDDRITQATREFQKVCYQRRAEFYLETPDMLKYQPKRFWGMLGTSKPNADISAQDFATFNEKLYFDESIPEDQFILPEDIENAKFTSEEVK